MRPEKTTIVQGIREKLDQSSFVLIVDFTGMKVPHFEDLRSRLAEAGARLSVVRNTFLRIAATELSMPGLDDSLAGQTAMVTGGEDICAAAKAIKNFAAEFKLPVVKAGVMDNAPLDAGQVAELADLPSKDALRAMLLGVLQAPAGRLVRVLNEPGASLARLLQAQAEALGGGQEG